jgi:hypothetical protein
VIYLEDTDQADMSGLWQSEEPAEWLRNLEAAPDRIADVGKDSLVELDSWFVDELPTSIRSRDQPSLTSDELVKLVGFPSFTFVLPLCFSDKAFPAGNTKLSSSDIAQSGQA